MGKTKRIIRFERIRVGESLEGIARPSYETPTPISLGEGQSAIRALMIGLRSSEAIVLYRDNSDGQAPSRGSLQLREYFLEEEKIWSARVDESRKYESKWNKLLNKYEISG